MNLVHRSWRDHEIPEVATSPGIRKRRSERSRVAVHDQPGHHRHHVLAGGCVMRYWTLFTLRMMSRLCLAFALLCWSLSPSEAVSGGIHYRDTMAVLTICDSGWQIATLETVSRPTIQWILYAAIIDPADWAGSSSTTVTTWAWSVSGLGYCQTAGPGRGEWLLISHWLLCVTFLIATIVTSVRSRKTPADATTESVNE